MMKIKLIDDSPAIERRSSGLYSLDRALGGGLPMRGLYEVYGHEHVGKSSLAYHLLGRMESGSRVRIMDVEGFDPSYATRALDRAGFEGTLDNVSPVDKKGKPREHDEMLQELIESILQEDVSGVVLDSVGAYIPRAIAAGEVGESFVGNRARDISDAARRIVWALRASPNPSLAIVTNHEHPIIGGRGTSTSGGVVLKYLAAVRLKMWRKEHFMLDTNANEPDGYLAEGVIEKNRFGGKGGRFLLYFLEGGGLHPGMTAVFDCIRLGIADRGAIVKIDNESHGYLNATLLKAALDGETEPFEPFFRALEEHNEATDPAGDGDTSPEESEA